MEHSLTEWCWCQPRIEKVLNLDGEECHIIIHRQLWDMEDA